MSESAPLRFSRPIARKARAISYMSSLPSPSASNCAKSAGMLYLPFSPFAAGLMPFFRPLSMTAAFFTGVSMTAAFFTGASPKDPGAAVLAPHPISADGTEVEWRGLRADASIEVGQIRN